MAFRVELAAEAQADAASILAWLLSQHAGDAGIRWMLAMEDTIASLAPEDREFPFEVRQLLYGRKPHVYRILFTIDGDTVHVLHIRHGRRKPVSGY